LSAFTIDIGCGAGDYAIKASGIVGDSGTVYALDQWNETISKLNEKINSLNIKNINAITADITSLLPVNDNSFDVCLIVMVLHGIDLSLYGETLFSEINRILKPNGRIAIIEIKKEEMSFGPPMYIRLSPAEIENEIIKYRFKKISYKDLKYTYMLQFEAY